MISRIVSKQVLLIGPDFHDHRGGIAAVIDIHRKQYEVFNFIPSFRSGSSKWSKAVFFIRQLFRILSYLVKNPEIKIVHIHSSKRGSLYRKLIVSCFVKWVFRKKTINHIHSGEFKWYYEQSNTLTRMIIRYFMNMHDVTIALSDTWKNYFETAFSLDKIYTISNLIEEQNCCQIRHDWPDGSRIQFLFLGNIEHHKGIFDLIDVIVESSEYLNSRFKLIIGGNGKSDILKELILKHNIENLVEFRGWISGNDKNKAISEADVFILPSHYEGVPVSILEAMSYGKPVIATTVGGIPDLVKSGTNGILINPHDRKALREAIMFYVDDPQNICRHGLQSVERVREFYPRVVIPKLEAIYSSLLSAS